MELVFTRDVPGRHGIKFHAGERRDWPRDTWNRIAESLGVPLKDIAITPDEAAKLATRAHSALRTINSESAPTKSKPARRKASAKSTDRRELRA